MAHVARFVNGDSPALTIRATAAQADSVRELIGRRRSPSPAIHHVRRDIFMALRPRGLAEPLSTFCRRYGLVDDKGLIRGSEACRLLIFVYLFRRSADRVRQTVDAAVRANKPMMVGAMSKRLTMLFRTAESHRAGGDRRTNEEKGVVRVVLDDWLYQTLQGYEVQYRNAEGLVDDLKLVSDIMRASLVDRDLGTITQAYTRRVEPLRRGIQQIEAYAAGVLRRVIGEEVPVERLARVG